MKTLLAAALLAVFALGSVAVLADDKTDNKTTPEEQAKMKADRAAAKAKQAKMTPEEKQAARAARKQQKQKELSQAVNVGNPQTGQDKAAAIAKTTAATKSDPKALPDNKAKQEALKEQEKKASGQ